MADDEPIPPADDALNDQPDKDWQAEASKWKALARKHEKAAKDNADAARRLAEIEESGPDDEYFDARVKVLSEMIRHHVREEEKRDGMFAKAKSSGMDLPALGEQMQERKAELEAQGADGLAH